LQLSGLLNKEMSGNKNLKNKQEVTELIGKIIELSLKLIVGRKNYKIV
jgi:hypothetical protein